MVTEKKKVALTHKNPQSIIKTKTQTSYNRIYTGGFFH